MPVPSLVAMATRAAIANVDRISDVGEAPYDLLRPVLLKVRNADQLAALEEASPHICGADAEVWRNLIKRDTNYDARNIEPKDPTKWSKLYKKHLRAAEEKAASAAEALKAAFGRHAADKQVHSTTMVNRIAVPSRSRSGWGSPGIRKPTGGASIVEKARREAREAAIFRTRDQLAKTRPSFSQHNQRKGTVSYAPKGLADKLAPAGPLNSSDAPSRPNDSSPPVQRRLLPTKSPSTVQKPSLTQASRVRTPPQPSYSAPKRKLPPSNVFQSNQKKRPWM